MLRQEDRKEMDISTSSDVIHDDDVTVETPDITPLWKEVPDETEVIRSQLDKVKTSGMAFLYRRGMPRTCVLIGFAGLLLYAVYVITPLIIGTDGNTSVESPEGAADVLVNQSVAPHIIDQQGMAPHVLNLPTKTQLLDTLEDLSDERESTEIQPLDTLEDLNDERKLTKIQPLDTLEDLTIEEELLDVNTETKGASSFPVLDRLATQVEETIEDLPLPDGVMEKDGLLMLTEEAADALHHISYINISQLTRPPYLAKYKNPCWLEDKSCSLREQRGDMPDCVAGHMQLLRCLPFFILSGAPHSGVEDLSRKLILHQKVALNLMDDPPEFWTDRLYHPGGRFHDYIRAYELATREIKRACGRRSDGTCSGQFITGDVTEGTFFDNRLWGALPGNHGFDQPQILTPHLLAKLNPEMKIILLLRDPVERLYSEYRSNLQGRVPPPTEFHNIVAMAIRRFDSCRTTNPLRTCIYQRDVGPFEVKLRVGLYAYFLHEWLSCFSRSQLLPIPYEHYRRDPMAVLQQVTDFLKIGASIVKYESFRDDRLPPDVDLNKLSSQTLSLLRSFYNTHNRDLPELLNDARFQWQ